MALRLNNVLSRVLPAQAGTQGMFMNCWTPAFAGVTNILLNPAPVSTGMTRRYDGTGIADLIFAAALMIAIPASAQDMGTILDDRDADAADARALQAEARLFENIRQGIALSIAQCELTTTCKPTVNREELRRILGKLETRLDALTNRHSKSGDAALEPVMLAYVGTRDGYNEFLTKLDTILPPESDDADADVLEDAANLPPEFAIFADADTDLTDDLDEVATEPTPQ